MTSTASTAIPDFYGTTTNQPEQQIFYGVERPWRLEDHIRRDARGRPYVIDPHGRERTYTRVTTFVDEIDKVNHLEQWRRRTLLKGFAGKPTLNAAKVAAAVGAEDERTVLNDLAEELIDVGGGRDAADTGNCVHALTERHDIGLPTPILPEDFVPHLEQWRRLTAPFTWVAIEHFMVNDDLETAGTPDRLGRRRRPCPECGRHVRVVDLKGGRVLDDRGRGDSFAIGKIARQMAVYQHSDLYDHEGWARAPVEDLCLCCAHIVSIPNEAPEAAELVTVDTRRAWQDVAHLIPQIRQARSEARKTPVVVEDVLLLTIQEATSVEQLQDLWAGTPGGRWTPVHSAAANERLAELQT